MIACEAMYTAFCGVAVPLPQSLAELNDSWFHRYSVYCLHDGRLFDPFYHNLLSTLRSTPRTEVQI